MHWCLNCSKITKSNNKNQECVFAGESRYDIEEIIRIKDIIFGSDEKYIVGSENWGKVVFVDGGLGSGKTYKLEKVMKLKYGEEDERKTKYQFFNSFQTGFNQNFIYILFLKLLEDEAIKKHWGIFKFNVTKSKAHFFCIPITISLSVILYTFLKVFDFTGFIFGHNVGYALFIIGVYLISLAILPYVLTYKRDYSVINRDYYYTLVTSLLGDVLIIDDFERLTNDQRKQVYEYIDFIRENGNNKLKIIILGDLQAIEKKEKESEISSSESFVSKYYDTRIILEDWIDTFEMQYNSQNLPPLNAPEINHIKSFLKHYRNIISRRSFVKFMAAEPIIYSYEDISYEGHYRLELLDTKNEEYDICNKKDFGEIEVGEASIDKIRSLIIDEIPNYKTYYVENSTIEQNPTVSNLIAEIPKYEYLYLKELKDAIKKCADEGDNVIRFFDSSNKIEKYNNSYNDYMFQDNKFRYTLVENVELFFQENINYILRDMRLESGYIRNISNNIIKNQLSSLCKIAGNEEQLTTEIKKINKHNYVSLKVEDIKPIIFKAITEYEKFKENFVFNLIKQYEYRFNLLEATNCYQIIKCNTSDYMEIFIDDKTNIELLKKFIDEAIQDEDAKNERIAIVLLLEEEMTTKSIEELYPNLSEEKEEVCDIIKEIRSLDSSNVKEFEDKYQFIKSSTIKRFNDRI